MPVLSQRICTARRSFRPMLESFDGIVFVHPNASDQELIASSDEELRSLLEDEAIRGNDVPILIIVEGNGDNQPDYAGAIAKMVRESRVCGDFGMVFQFLQLGC